uniref:Uncharacterized protein n=1 Tax=Fagus sylvatica TaxID=28930 RepID=A0A2N9IZ83_FAGSY
MVMVSMGTWLRLQWCDGGNVGENFVVVIVVVALEEVTVVTSAMVMVATDGGDNGNAKDSVVQVAVANDGGCMETKTTITTMVVQTDIWMR